MIRTHILPCHLPTEQTRALNQESGRIYSATLVYHWRLFRKQGVWLKLMKHRHVLDYVSGPSALLHAHSVDAAQEDFYESCKSAKELKKVNPLARYPYKRKFYHTTTWKHTAIKVVDGRMRLALARGQPHVWLALPDHLAYLPAEAFRQVQLCYSHATQTNTWHLTVEDQVVPPPPQGTGIMAVDMGEIHPAACTNGEAATIISCRALRANAQHRNKKAADLQEQLARCQKGSRRWHKLTRSRKKLQAQTENRQRDLLHKVSRAVVEEAEAMGTGTIVIGDVRDIADGTKKAKRLSREVRQKISNWPHGQLRQYIEYKAAAQGIVVELINEAYTSKTCPRCGHLNKPNGRRYRCSACGHVGHRDNVGSANILSKKQTGKLAQRLPCSAIKYRHPVRRGSVVRPDTRWASAMVPVACVSKNPTSLSRPLGDGRPTRKNPPSLEGVRSVKSILTVIVISMLVVATQRVKGENLLIRKSGAWDANTKDPK